jgi:glycosyltransferase involved in cell wall biosynthesis
VEDIRPYLWKATLAVVPLVYGAGIQNKILEAMAGETPVITTSSALSSLRAIAGTDALVADTAEDFCAAILRLIENPTLQREVGRAGFTYVKNYHDWKMLVAQLIAIYAQVIASKNGRVGI